MQATALAHSPGLASRGGAFVAELARVAAGRSTLAPVKGDRRFADPAWYRQFPLR